MPSAPSRVRWTDHALEKAALLDIARTDIEQAVIEHSRPLGIAAAA